MISGSLGQISVGSNNLAPPVPYLTTPCPACAACLLNGRIPVRDGYRSGHREIRAEMKAWRDAH